MVKRRVLLMAGMPPTGRSSIRCWIRPHAQPCASDRARRDRRHRHAAPALQPDPVDLDRHRQLPAKHGITGFIEPTGDGRAVRPVSSLSRKVKALWNILGQNGLRSVVVGCIPPTRPNRSTASWSPTCSSRPATAGTPNRFPPGSVHPPLGGADAGAAPVGRGNPRRGDPRIRAEGGRDRPDEGPAAAIGGHIVAENMNAHNAATEAIEHTDWDLACLFYDGIDHFSHGFMRYHPPRLDWVSEEDFDRYSGVLAACYRWHDAMLGRLLELAGPDVTTIIVSDHGFESGRNRLPDVPAELAGPTQDHRHFGVLVMAGPGIKADERIHTASLLDIAPTVLHLFGLPVGRDMDGKVLLPAFAQPEPVQRIDSWEQMEGNAGQHPPGRIQEPLAALEAMKQLEDLGYIAPQAGEAAQAVTEAVVEQHYTLAQSYEDAGRPDLADAEYVQMLELWPTDHRALAGRVSMLLSMQEVTAAQGVLDAFDAAATAAAEHAKAELARREAEKPAADLRDAPDTPETKREVHERRKLFQALGGRWVQRMALRANVLLASGDTTAAVATMEAARAAIAEQGGAFGATALADFYGRAGSAAWRWSTATPGWRPIRRTGTCWGCARGCTWTTAIWRKRWPTPPPRLAWCISSRRSTSCWAWHALGWASTRRRSRHCWSRWPRRPACCRRMKRWPISTCIRWTGRTGPPGTGRRPRGCASSGSSRQWIRRPRRSWRRTGVRYFPATWASRIPTAMRRWWSWLDCRVAAHRC